MTLGGEMNNGARLSAPKQLTQKIAIKDVSLLETIARVRVDGAQVVEIARVRQLVEIHDARAFGRYPVENEVRANEARATGYEDKIFHGKKRSVVKDAAFRF